MKDINYPVAIESIIVYEDEFPVDCYLTKKNIAQAIKLLKEVEK